MSGRKALAAALRASTRGLALPPALPTQATSLASNFVDEAVSTPNALLPGVATATTSGLGSATSAMKFGVKRSMSSSNENHGAKGDGQAMSGDEMDSPSEPSFRATTATGAFDGQDDDDDDEDWEDERGQVLSDAAALSAIVDYNLDDEQRPYQFRPHRLFFPRQAYDPKLGLWRPARMKTLGSNYRSFSSSAELVEQTVDDEGEDGADKPTVMEYLQSRGINIAALAELELPKSKSIIKERLDYLQNVIGLTIKDINDYPLMIGCSVRKNLSPVVQFLQTLKVTKNSLPVMIRKYPQVLHSSVAIDLIPNVRFIQGLGIELKQVGSVLTRYPQLLGYRIEGTMSTSVAYLVMIGVDKRQIGPVLTEKPEIMGMRVSNNLRPKVEFIVSCGIPHLVVGKMIENRPYILDYEVDGRMQPAVDALLELGVRKEALPGMLIQYPELLGMKVKDKVEAKLPWLTAKVGVRREDMAAILEKLPQILAMNVPTGTKRVHALRELGLTKEEVARMIVACPQLIGLSIEKRIVPNGGFLVKEMERDIKELLKFPAFLTYDLDTRIRPRFQKIKEKGITCSLVWMVNCSDAKFEERLKTGYSPEASEEVDATFDTVGRLRVHENVPRDDEDEDKHRPVRLRNRDPPRAQASRPNPMA